MKQEFKISAALMDSILKYLGTKPWTEVNNLIVGLGDAIKASKEKNEADVD